MIAKLVRQFGTPERGVRANAWRALERAMDGAGITWTDLGNWIEHGGGGDDGAYTEDELQQFGQARHAEGVDAGIKIGEARKSSGGRNGHIVLPKPSDMAEYCQQRLNRMKDDAQRDFVRETYAKTQRGTNLYAGTLGYLASLYMKHGGKFQC
jgi:hypothetical protein